MLSNYTNEEILEEYRLRFNTLRETIKIGGAPEAIAKFITHYESLDQSRESFVIMFLDQQNKFIKIETLFTGTINSSAVYPREIIKAVLECNAQNVILSHNHPSGKVDPSSSDRLVTKKIKTALESIDVNLLDHIIYGNGSLKTFSFMNAGIL